MPGSPGGRGELDTPGVFHVPGTTGVFGIPGTPGGLGLFGVFHVPGATGVLGTLGVPGELGPTGILGVFGGMLGDPGTFGVCGTMSSEGAFGTLGENEVPGAELGGVVITVTQGTCGVVVELKSSFGGFSRGIVRVDTDVVVLNTVEEIFSVASLGVCGTPGKFWSGGLTKPGLVLVERED